MVVKSKTGAADRAAFRSLGEGQAFQDKLFDMLEHVIVFKDLEARELRTLANFAHAYVVDKGNYLFREGDRDSALFVITEGEVRIFKESGQGENREIALVRKGTILGEMSVVDGQPFSASAQAATPTKLVLITRNNVLKITETNPALGVKMLWQMGRLISLRLRRTSGMLTEYLYD